MARTDFPAQHIAIVVHSLSSGGAQRRLVTLANAFAAAGRTVSFVALRRDGAVDALLDARVGIAVLDERPRPKWKPWALEGRGALRRWLAKQQPDVVLAGVHTVHATVLAASRQLAGKRPAVVLRASQHPVRKFPWSRPFKRLREPIERRWRRGLYERADRVIAVSEEVAEALRARMRGRDQVIALPNPVITADFVESLGRGADHPWLAEAPPLILAIGRLVWSKRFDVLIEALGFARRELPARLIILGEGKARGALERRVAALGLADAVAMPGNMPQVGRWLAGADLLVSTSAYEGSPAVLVEALAAGVPVVAADGPGGSKELLAEGQGGSLVAVGDAAATARAILRELTRRRDPEALRSLVAGYGAEASAAAYLDVLDGAAALTEIR